MNRIEKNVNILIKKIINQNLLLFQSLFRERASFYTHNIINYDLNEQNNLSIKLLT